MSDAAGGFIGVFEQRVQMLRKRLKEELAKKKSDRSKHTLKTIIKEIKEWETFLKKHKKHGKFCPNCGHNLENI